MSFKWTDRDLEIIADQPHLIGHILGKDKLTIEHSEMLKHLWYSDKDQAAQAHRGWYKTTICTEIGCVARWLFHPNDRILVVRKSSDEAADTADAIGKYMQDEKLASLFEYAHGFPPRLLIDAYGKKLFNFKQTVTKERSLETQGIESLKTGTHFDIIVADDIITLKDRVSRAAREKTKLGVMELKNLIDPWGSIKYVGTPWHEDDAWEMKKPNSHETIIPKPMKVSIRTTTVLTEEQIEEKRSSMSPSMFAANFELEHKADEDQLFKDPVYGFWEHNDNPIYFHIDAKYKGLDTGSLTVGSERRDGKLQMRGYYFTQNLKDVTEWLIDCCREMGVKEGDMEDNGDKGFGADLLRKRKDGSIGLKITDYHESMNKHIKISTYLVKMWDKIVWDERTDPEYMVQITDYREKQEPDDAPDSASSLIRERFYESTKSDDYLSLYQD